MKKHKFKNASNFERFGRSLRLVSLIGFGLSTVTSTVGLAGTAVEAFSVTSWYVYAVWALAFVASYIIDFKWAKPALRFFMSELLARMTGRVRPAMFAGVLLIGSFIAAAGGLLFSASTTWVGSNLLGAAVSRSIVPSVSTADVFDKQTDATAKALQPYRDRLIDLETERDREIASRAGGELQRLAKRGNAWAKGEVESIRASITQKYAKPLADAQKAFDKEKARLDGLATTVLTSVSKREDFALTTAKNTSNTSRYWLQLVGLLGLGLGVVITLMEATGDVAKELPELTDAEAREIEARREGGFLKGLVGGLHAENPLGSIGNRAPSQSGNNGESKF